LLHRFLAAGATAWSRYDESIEVVVRRPVPATAVSKLSALSQTTREAKQRRARAAGRDPFDESD
jgi:hypothetical protein